jgi:uncharacterized protein YjiS (DUF1127 family)
MFEQMRSRFGRWQHYQRILAELNTHSDRELAEMGLLRCDLRRIARESMSR